MITDRPADDDQSRDTGTAPSTLGSARDAICQAMHRSIVVDRLPPPPSSRAEWQERAMRACDGMPGMQEELPHVPVGWFSLVERATEEVRRLLPPGAILYTTQMKEKFGTLRWYCHEDSGLDGPSGIEGATDWAEDLSSKVCALFGTPDGVQVDVSGWWLTLSPQAQLHSHGGRARAASLALNALMYPRWHD